VKNIDVLNLEWPNNERDVHAVAPVILELRNRGLVCVTGDIFSYIFYLIKYRPKVLLLTSYQGALINHKLCKVASFIGIKIITLIAEGNTRETAIKEMTWGNNKEMALYFEKMLLWSYRSESLMHKHFPQLLGRTSVVGGVGFDRYKRLHFLSKESFLNQIKYKKKYEKIIGLAGWGFDRVHDTDFYYKNKKSILASFKEGQKELHKNDFILIQGYMQKVIQSNPDVLFILRPHPGLTDYYYDEFKELKSLPNTYYSEPRVCPFSISDLISASDLWGGYETTTCLEAWLLGKETFLLNPSGGSFNRDITAKGSYQISDINQLNKVVSSEEELNMIIDDSSIVISHRKDIISGVIGFDDGKNYLRAVNEIEPIVEAAIPPQYSIVKILKCISTTEFIRSVFRNINILNEIRGLRSTDQYQIERAITQYKKTNKL
jgi:hypothetical protein